MTDINPKLAVDLDAVKQQQIKDELEAKRAQEDLERRQQAAISAQAKAWEKAMKRAFKGIHTHQNRVRLIRQADNA